MRTELLKSPFTGADEHCSYWGMKDAQPIYVCSETGALFFDRSKLKEYTYQDYYEYLPKFDSKRVQWELIARKPNLTNQLLEALRFLEKDTCNHLDIGAGPGYCVKIGQDLGLASIGVEMAEKAIAHGQKWYNVNYSTLEEIDDESIDLITCHHVLEHIPDVFEFIALLKSKLTKNGLLIFHVPHQQPLTFLLRDLMNFSKDAERVCSLYANIHLSGFTVSSLQKATEIHGFKTLKCISRGMWSKYYDPFFFRNYVRSKSYGTIGKKATRHVIENFGQLFNLNDWVIGYFQKM